MDTKKVSDQNTSISKSSVPETGQSASVSENPVRSIYGPFFILFTLTIFIIWLGYFVIVSSSHKKYDDVLVTNERLTSISDAFQSLLGPNWTFLLTLGCIFIFIVLILLYFGSYSLFSDINILSVFTALFLFLIILIITIYLKFSRNKVDEYHLPDDQTYYNFYNNSLDVVIFLSTIMIVFTIIMYYKLNQIEYLSSITMLTLVCVISFYLYSINLNPNSFTNTNTNINKNKQKIFIIVGSVSMLIAYYINRKRQKS